MNDLDKRIQKRFKDSIAISNLKEEFVMKKAIKKQVITLSMLGIVFLSGGFLTVNAATGGELANSIKEKIMDSIKIEGVEVTEENMEIEEYETNENGEVTSVTFIIDDEDISGNSYKIKDIKE